MSQDVALQAMFDRFLGRFVLPLVAGERRGGDEEKLLVSYPLGEGAVAFFEDAQQVDNQVTSQIMRARQATIKKLISWAPPEPFRPEERRLLAALHNVLLCNHEEVVTGMRGKSRWNHTLEWAASHLSKVSECNTADLAVQRHSLLHHLPELTREDVILQARRSSKRYLGQDPPRRALIWPKLRRLHTSESTVDLLEVVTGEGARDLFTQILERSPLTCLLNMPYGQEDSFHEAKFRWSPQILAVLRRRDLCRAVTYGHMELGLSAVGPALARGTLAGIERLTESRDEAGVQAIKFGLRYILNLQLTHLWTAPEDDLTSPLDARWPTDSERERGYFFGWFAAALARSDRLGAPLPSDENLRNRETLYRQAAAGVAGAHMQHAARQVDWIFPPTAHEHREGGQH